MKYDRVHRALALIVFDRIEAGASSVTIPGGDLLSIEQVHQGPVLMTLKTRLHSALGSQPVRHFVVRVQEVK